MALWLHGWGNIESACLIAGTTPPARPLPAPSEVGEAPTATAACRDLALARGYPARDVDHAGDEWSHAHVGLLELNKSNRGSPWTAISRRSKRSLFLRSGRPSSWSWAASPARTKLALRRWFLGSLSCCGEREIAREPRRPSAARRCR